MYRSERDESKLKPEQLLAWEIVLPYRYVPIVDSDYQDAEAIATKLKKLFTPKALKAAAKLIQPLEYTVKL